MTKPSAPALFYEAGEEAGDVRVAVHPRGFRSLTKSRQPLLNPAPFASLCAAVS